MLSSLIELPLCSCWDALYHPCFPWAHAESVKYFPKEYHDSITQLCEFDLPITNDSYIHQSPNQVGIYQFIHDWKITIITSSFPCIVGVQITSYEQKGLIKRLWQTETNYYIIGLYMTFTSNDIHHIYNRDQIYNKTIIVISNYHTPCMICTISICQQHLDQQPVYVHH